MCSCICDLQIQEVVIAEVHESAVQHVHVVEQVARTAAQNAYLPVTALGLVREELVSMNGSN